MMDKGEIMSISEPEIESAVRGKGLTAPRITPEHLDRLVRDSRRQFHVFPGTTLTVCCLTLPNGYSVTGQSAAACPQNFDRVIGERIALADARDKLWALEGYLLRDRLSHE